MRPENAGSDRAELSADSLRGESPPDPAGPAYAVHNATVHSTAEPYADAFIVENGTISWIGAEESVRHLPGQPAQRCDAEGALAAPAFTGWLRLGPFSAGESGAWNADDTRTGSDDADYDAVQDLRRRMDEALCCGIGLLRLSVAIEVTPELGEASVRRRGAQALTEVFRSAAEHPIPVQPILALHGPDVLQLGTVEGTTQHVRALLQEIEALLAEAPLTGLAASELAVECPAGTLVTSGAEAGRSHEILLGWRRFARGEGRQLILAADRTAGRGRPDDTSPSGSQPGAGTQDVSAPSMDEPAAHRFAEALLSAHRELLTTGRSAAPGRPTIVAGFDTADRDLWAEMLNTAVHVCFTGPGHLATALSVGLPAFAAAPEGQNPWQLVSELVHREADSLSVRAAFNAQVRGARRALPAGHGQPAPSMGHLNAGEPATFVLWQADALAVQTPESRVAAWSTDARSRTPLLPYLDGTAVPQWTVTVIDGVWHHMPES